MSTFEQDVYTIFNQAVYKDIVNLYKNGEFYQQNDELEGALISYSSCASMIHTILQINYDCTPKCTTPVSTSVSLDLPGPQISDNGEHPAGVQLSNATTDTRVNIKASSSQDNNTKDLPPTYDFLEKLKASFIQTLEKKYQTILSRVEQLQKKLKDKKQTLKNSNAEDDEEEWLQACTKIHPAIFKDGSKDCIFFKDLAGLQKQKDQIKKALIQPLIYENLYPKVGKGFLLYGPPGTGKTLLVKAAVNELQLEDENVRVLFFAPTGATLKGKYVGDTEKRIVEAYKCASLAACKCEKNNPEKKYISVIFIDEIDSIAGDRNKDETGLMANSVNTLLQVIDGLESPANVATIGATNYPWQLDAAVLRRFDTQILLGLPDSPQIEKAMNISFNKFIKLKLSDWKDGCSKLQRYLQDDSNKETQNKTSKKENDACAKGCSSKSKNVDIYKTSPYNIFKYSYTDSDNLIRSISDELSSDTKYFSFSDVDKVMGLAKTLTATTSLEYIFYNPSKTIPELTTLKDSTDNKLLSNFYLSSINKPRNGKSFNSVLSQYYEKLNNLVNDKKIINTEEPDWEDKKFTINQNKLKEFYQNFHISKFPKCPFIKKDNKTYYNSKLLFDLDPNLLIEDPNINDVYIYCQTQYLLDIYNENWHELIKLSYNSQLQKLINAEAEEAEEAEAEEAAANRAAAAETGRAAAAEDDRVEEEKFEDALAYQNGGNETVSHDENDSVRVRLLNGSRSSASARLNKFKADINTAKKASNPIIDIETINCLNLEDSQRKKIINTLLEKNLLKITWLPGLKIINSKKVDIIVSTDRAVKSQTTKNVEYDNAIMSLGLGSYLKKELDYKINSYLCKSIKFISSARKHLEFYLKNINIIHKFESKRNLFDATVWGYKNTDPTEFRNSIVANILMKRLDDDSPDQIIENKSLQQCKNSPYFKNFMNGYINLSDFLKTTHNKQCNIKIYWLFTNIRYLLNEPTIDNSDYKDKTNQIKLIFEAFFPQSVYDPSQTFDLLQGNDEEIQDLLELYTSKNILNVFDSIDINVLLKANLNKINQKSNELFTKFMNKIYDKVQEIYHQILQASGEQLEHEVDASGEIVRSEVVNRSIIELNQDQIDEFEQETLYINEFFVEKIPFITNNVFNKFSYEKQLSIDLLKLVNRAKDNLDKTLENINQKKLATAILNYQSYLSIVLNILASTQNELFIKKSKQDVSIDSAHNTDCYIDKYFSKSNLGNSNDVSNDCFKSFVMCFYNIWKNNISQVQKEVNIQLKGLDEEDLDEEDLESNLSLEQAKDKLNTKISNLSPIYAYYLSSNDLDCSKTAAKINSNSFHKIDSNENLSRLTDRKWIGDNKFFFEIPLDVDNKEEEKEKCAEFFNVGKMQFSFVQNPNKDTDMMKMRNKISTALVAIGCLEDTGNTDDNPPDDTIKYTQDIKLFENKSTRPVTFQFLYECKLDLNNENYRGILKTKSFIKSSFSSIFKLISDLFNSGKKPKMSEFKSLAKRIKKMNPDISVLHYILRLTNSVGIISPYTNNIFWSNIKNIQPIETTSQSIDRIYEKLFGRSPEEEEANAEKEKWDGTKRFAVYTSASAFGTLLYGAGTILGFASGGAVLAAIVYAATLIFLAQNIRSRMSRGDDWKSALMGEAGMAVVGGLIGTGVGHIINRKLYGEGNIAYQQGMKYRRSTEGKIRNEVPQPAPIVPDTEEEVNIDGEEWNGTRIFYSDEAGEHSIQKPDYSRFIGEYLSDEVSTAGKAAFNLYKEARQNSPDTAKFIAKFINGSKEIVKFDWPVSATYLITFALAYPGIKSLYKNIMGYSSTPLFNEALIDSIGPYGNDDIVFDISTEKTLDEYAASVSSDVGVQGIDEKKKIELKGDCISRAYLTAYLRKISKNAFESSSYYNLSKLADLDFSDFDFPSIHEEMSNVIPKSVVPDVNHFKRRGRVYTSFIVEFDRTEFGPEINSIVSSNQKKLKIIDILPDKIKIAASEQPQSYDPILGGMLNDYSENRLKFLEDFKNGKYNKKTG